MIDIKKILCIVLSAIVGSQRRRMIEMELIIKSMLGLLDYIIENKLWCKMGLHSICMPYGKRREGVDYYCRKCGAEWVKNKYGIYKRIETKSIK